MKKFNFIIFILFFSLFYSKIHSSELDVKAKTVILQDYLSGKILYEKEPDLPIFPASMTKIMTTIIAFDLIKKSTALKAYKFNLLYKYLVHQINIF